MAHENAGCKQLGRTAHSPIKTVLRRRFAEAQQSIPAGRTIRQRTTTGRAATRPEFASANWRRGSRRKTEAQPRLAECQPGVTCPPFYPIATGKPTGSQTAKSGLDPRRADSSGGSSWLSSAQRESYSAHLNRSSPGAVVKRQTFLRARPRQVSPKAGIWAVFSCPRGGCWTKITGRAAGSHR